MSVCRHSPERPSQRRTSRATEAVSTSGASRNQRRSTTPPGCVHVCRSANVVRSHTQSRPSIPPLAASCRQSQKPALSMEASWAASCASSLPPSACASFSRPSTAPKRKTGWTGCATRHEIGTGSWIEPACRQWSTVPALGFHTRTVPSSDAVSTARPLLAKQPYATDDECAEKICMT
eukprot:7063225-Prymnesium_polylepis.1